MISPATESKKSALRSLRVAAIGVGVAVALSAPEAYSQQLPSMKMGRAQLVSPTAGDAYFGGSVCHTYGLVDPSNCRTDAPPGYVRHIDIRTAARALGAGGFTADQYVNAVHEFIKNGVDTEFRYGLAKGALGVLLDRAGTPFDQAHLMVELLAEGGISASYKLGTITLSGPEFASWTTITDAKAACRFLANGGISAIVNGSTNPTCSYTGAVESVTLSHVWVEAQIAGTAYVFDPSFKAYSRAKLLDLAALPAYSRASFVSNALAGSMPTTINGSPGIHHVNRSAIEANLSDFGEAALAAIRQNHSEATREELLGIPRLIRIEMIDTGPRQTELPYPSSVSRTLVLHVPDAYRTSLRLRGIENRLDRVLYVDEVYGERIQIAPINISTDTDVRLTVGDAVVETVPLANYPTGFYGPWEQMSYAFRLDMAINHPYVDQNGAYMDQAVTKQTKLHTATAIVFGAGNRGALINSRWQSELKEDEFLPTYAPGDAIVGGQATHDKTKLLQTSEWLQQFAMALETLAGVSDTLIQHHHSIGVAYSDVTIIGGTDGGSGPPVYGYVADHALRTNLSSGISVAQRQGVDADAIAAERAAAALAATLEGSVAEQEGGSPEASSTHTRFVWGAQFTADESVVLIPALSDVNSYTSYIRQVACPWFTTTGELNAIQAYLSAGYNVLVHQNLCLGPGQYEDSSQPTTTHKKSIARGAAFVAFKPDYSDIAHVQANGHFVMKGAGASLTPTQFAPTQAADLLRDDFKARDTRGVDLRTGSLSYVPPADITTGTGDFPYSLSLQRSFKAGAVPNGSFGEGWTHNFASHAVMSSSGMEAMGERLPSAVAASATALYVTFDLFRDAGSVSSMTIPSFVQHWWHQQLVANVVTVTQGTASKTFVRLADDAWAPPPDDFSFLSITGSRRMVGTNNFGCPTTAADWNNTSRKPLAWNYSQMTIVVTGRHGDKQTYSHWCIPPAGDEQSERSGFRLTKWEFPSGVLVDYFYATDGSLQGVRNSLGRFLGFSHTGLWDHHTKEYLVRLNWVQDDSGRQVTFGYEDNRPVLSSVTLPDLRQWSYRYLTPAPPSAGYPANQRPMDFRQLYQVFEPISTQPALQFAYDGTWSVKSISDAVALQGGSRSAWSYLITPDHLGEQASPLGTTYRVYHDENGRPSILVDELGQRIRVSYDNRGLVTRREFPEQNAVEFAYDSRGNTTQRRQLAKPGSSIAEIVSSAIFPASCSLSTAATCNKPTSSTDARNQTTNYVWDDTTGMLKNIQAPAPEPGGLRPRTDYCYSSFGSGFRLLTGRVQKVDATRARVQTYSYDAGDKYVPLSTTMDPQQSLDENCNVTSKTDALNLVTVYDHDARGNLISTDGPRTDVADVVSHSFDEMRRMTRTQMGAAITRMEYDANGRLRKERKARVATPNESSIDESEWQTETREYSPTGQVTAIIDSENHATSFVHDALDRVVLTVDAESRRVGTVYDAAGRKSCEWRGWNSPAAPTSCAWNPASYESAYAGPYRYAAYEYTANGQQSSITDANGNITEYQYDGADRLQFTYFPDPLDGTRCVRASGDASMPTCSGGQTYEKQTYDPAGNVVATLTRKGDLISRTYDGLARLKTKSAAGLPDVSHGYNLLNEPMSLTSPSGSGMPAHAIGYDYDAAGRRRYEDNLIGGQTLRVAYEYDRAGNRARTAWNDGYFVTYEYDALNRMRYAREQGSTELAFYDYDTLSRRALLRYAGSSANQVNYQYELDGDLDVLTHTMSGSGPVVLDYGYDNASKIRKISANDDFYLPTPAAQTTAYARNRLNQYGSVGGNASVYDLNGNMTEWGPAAQRWTYAYDSENRLRTASLNGSLVASYDYDPLGRRISKTANGIVTFYQLDGDEEIAEYDSSGSTLGALLRRYVTGPAIDDRIARVEVSGAQAGKHYYRVNHQGSVIITTNDAGGIRQQLAYDEYGVLSSQPPAATTGEQFRYTGRRYDHETGLYYYRARYYSAEMGRFLQTDPIGYEDDLNVYAYVKNDPLNAIDPTGTCTGSHIENSDGTCASTGGSTTGTAGVAEGVTLSRAAAARTAALGTLRTTVTAAGTAAVADGPAPAGDAVGLAILAVGGVVAASQASDELMDKMASEVQGIIDRATGPQAEQYSLRAVSSGYYPSVRDGIVFLNAGDVWKYGQTTDPAGRYSAATLSTLGVRYVTEFRGGRTQALIQEKLKIYGYFLTHGSLPPGNKIFR